MRKSQCRLLLKPWTVPPPRLWELRQSRPEPPSPPTPAVDAVFSVSHGVCSSHWHCSCFLFSAAGQWSTSPWGPMEDHLFGCRPATINGFQRMTQPPLSPTSPPIAPWVSWQCHVIPLGEDCRVMVMSLRLFVCKWHIFVCLFFVWIGKNEKDLTINQCVNSFLN